MKKGFLFIICIVLYVYLSAETFNDYLNKLEGAWLHGTRLTAKAYDNMGGLTLNIGSLGALTDMISTGIARNNETGQSGNWNKIAEKLQGKGIFEINIGSKGISGKFGMEGFDLAGSLYTFGKRMNDKAFLESYIAENEDKSEKARKATETVWKNYVYGDSTQENTAIRIAADKDQLEFVKEKEAGWIAQTMNNGRGGRLIQMVDSGDSNINAIQLGHEAYRNGIKGNEADQKAETIAAVMGHAGMAGRMMGYKGNEIGDIYALEGALNNLGRFDLLNKIADGMYDSSGDYWKLTWGGQLINDGQGWLVDENGMYINIDGTRSPVPVNGQTLGVGTFDDNGTPRKGSIETGLLNIIAGTSGQAYSSFSDEQIKAAQALMTGADKPMEPSNPDANFREFDWSQNLSGQKIDMTSFMKTAGANVNQEIFKTYYNNTVDSQISKMLGVDLGFDTGKEIPKNQYGNYTALFGNALIEYLKSGDAKQTLNDKYFQTLTNEQGESTKLYKLDKNNPFLDELLGQHDLKGVNPSIDSDGCNFISQLAVPQLLTGKIIKDTDIIDSIWKEANKDNRGVYSNSTVYDPEALSNIVMKKLNLNLKTSLGYKQYKEMQKIASRKTINYDKYTKDGVIKYHTHFVLSDVYGTTIYNPGYQYSGDFYEYDDYYLRGKK